MRQENHDLRQKLELQATEYEENHNTLRRRFQDTVSDLTSQVEALSKGKARFSFSLNISSSKQNPFPPFFLDMTRKVKHSSSKSKN